MPKSTQKPKFKLPLVPIAVVLMFILGAAVFLYPTISNYLAEKNASRKSDEYVASASALSEEEIAFERQKAIQYNESLNGDPVRDPFVEGSGMALPQNYLDVLNIKGIMCTVEIPSIHVKLPVMHGTSEKVLATAVGHIRQTGVPIGGVGNHPVLTGHTGLSKAKLFTDLTKLKKGDIFIIHVLDETQFYEIDDISVILPDELAGLAPIDGKDCVTLVTCTPYSVNSHRLLVRGERCEPTEDLKKLVNLKRTLLEIIKEYSALIIVVLFIIIFIIVWVLYLLKNRKKRKSQ